MTWLFKFLISIVSRGLPISTELFDILTEVQCRVETDSDNIDAAFQSKLLGSVISPRYRAICPAS